MRFYVRTSRRTGVSTGATGAAFLALVWFVVVTLPLAVVVWSFQQWYTAPLGIAAIALAVAWIVARVR